MSKAYGIITFCAWSFLWAPLTLQWGKRMGCVGIYHETWEHSNCGPLNKFLKSFMCKCVVLRISWNVREPNKSYWIGVIITDGWLRLKNAKWPPHRGIGARAGAWTHSYVRICSGFLCSGHTMVKHFYNRIFNLVWLSVGVNSLP